MAVAIAAPAAHALDAALLRALADHHLAIQRWMQHGTAVMQVVGEELDGDGKVKKRAESTRRIVLQDGERRIEILRALENGRDVTEVERKKQADREAKRRAAKNDAPAKGDRRARGSTFSSPFSAEAQPKHFFWSPDADASTGLLRVAFRAKGARSDGLLEGEALVDAAKGQLVRIAMRPSKLPTLVDRMEIEARLDAELNGSRLPSELKFSGEGGIAFLKRRGSGSTKFSEHQLPPESDAQRKAAE